MKGDDMTAAPLGVLSICQLPSLVAVAQYSHHQIPSSMFLSSDQSSEIHKRKACTLPYYNHNELVITLI